MSTFHKYFVI